MIKTFIFFDLETTGLITKTMPKITELSLIAVSRNAIYETLDPLPRILHKLVLPIHPNIDIPRKICTLTGLSNENLKGVQYFNCETYNLITSFINRMTTPVCFVAYNGNLFDYPILLSEFKNINKNFSEDVLSIDMLHLIKDLFLPKNVLIKKRDGIQTTPSMFNVEDVHSMLNDGNDKLLCDALDSVMSSDFDKYNKISDKSTESTSYSGNVLNTPTTSCYKKIQKINEKTPESHIIKLQDTDDSFHCNKKKSTARRRLYFSNAQPVNFKLTNISKHILGTSSENDHTAEGDCLTMIRCAIQLGEYFVEWADDKATPLINYEKK